MTLSRQHRADLKRKRSKLSPAAKSEHRAGVFEDYPAHAYPITIPQGEDYSFFPYYLIG